MNGTHAGRKDIRSAGPQFAAMAATYCLGAFNDNYFKQAAMLIAVTLGFSRLQGTATILFALPFILCSAYAGWVADRFAKKKVIVAAKGLECVAMLVGAMGVFTGNWPCILSMVFLMGLQSTFFSPALNGAIPELYPASRVPRANGILKLATTLAILAGIAAAGVCLDSGGSAGIGLDSGAALVAGVVVFISALGFLTSFGVYSQPAPGVRQPFPKFGPLSSFKDAAIICRDGQVLRAIFSDTSFYFIASLVVLTTNTLGLRQLGLTQTATSLLSMSLMLGVCAGSLVAGRLVDMARWDRFLVPASSGMAAGLFLTAASVLLPVPFQLAWLVVSLIVVGIAGGIFLIPVTSFLQVYPKRSEKGRVLATANFCGFIGILSSGLVFTVLDKLMLPATVMGCIGMGALLTTGFLSMTKRLDHYGLKTIVTGLVRRLVSLRYAIDVTGLDEIEADENRGIVFLPNHPALIDPVILLSARYPKFAPRPLVDTDQANKPLVRQIMKIIRPIEIPDINQYGQGSRARINAALDELVGCLNNKEAALMYPAGKLYRSHQEELGGNSGVEYILNHAPDTRFILVRTKGLWGSRFSWASGRAPALTKGIGKTIGFLLANLVFFGPRRMVTLALVEDDTLRSLDGRKAINRYLEAFYNREPERNTHVPAYWWQGASPEIRPEAIKTRVSANSDTVPAATANRVRAKIEAMVGHPVQREDRLAHDLAIDSLVLMEIALWLEREFGTTVADLTALDTVDDCILAASGQLPETGTSGINRIPPEWFYASDQPLSLSDACTIPALFLDKALRHPGKTIISDAVSGCKTYREIIAAIFLLKPLIEKIPGDRVGIMMPASVSASIVYLATLFSGKTPVMFNWTVGIANMTHGLADTGVSHILTARALWERIRAQGTDVSRLETHWVFLEQAAKATWLTKATVFFKAICCSQSLKKVPISETAAILFTSGSESQPKAVPLTHDNIIANLRDFTLMQTFQAGDKLLGMLPPFHSLGLAGTIIMPLCLGMKTVYHPDPTASATLADIISSYQASVLIGTPTFLNGIVSAGTPARLESLKLVFTGAEKCPEQLYGALRGMNPDTVLCEGYGITECSPLISINNPADNRPGSIGSVLPSIDYVIVDDETGEQAAPGQTGMLLVRGPNVFRGYLNDESDKGFREFQDKRWYLTGDFVREDSTKTLIFCGRKKRFVKLGGEMISLPAIETVLQRHFGKNGENGPCLAVEAAATEVYPEITLFSTFPVDREAVNAVIKQGGLSPLHHVWRVERIADIPVLGTGKTDYQALKQTLACEPVALRNTACLTIREMIK